MDALTRTLLDARRGDAAAMERFVRDTWSDVGSLCRYLGDPDSVDDLVQETYQRAFVALPRYRATGPARHWLLTIARRTCADHTRRRTRSRRLDRRVRDLVPLESGSIDSVPAEIDDLLHVLDEDRRAAFVLTQLHGLRYDEAAAVLDVPVGTIRSRVSRARDQLVATLHPAADAPVVPAKFAELRR
ncbi:MAG: sigma-70 family RNA polymerase sigma factor [Acidimicrobiia bacterium]